MWEGPGRCMGRGGKQGLLTEMKYWWEWDCRQKVWSQPAETVPKCQVSPSLLS